MYDDIFICGICGEIQPLPERTIFNGTALCANCVSEHTTLCSRCRCMVWCGNRIGDENTPLCDGCGDGSKR